MDKLYYKVRYIQTLLDNNLSLIHVTTVYRCFSPKSYSLMRYMNNE